MRYPESIERLIEEFSKIPGVGEKTAHRYAEYILKISRDEAEDLAHAIINVKLKIKTCRGCYGFAEEDYCPICKNTNRTEKTLCIVAEPPDVGVMERSTIFKGKYFVIGGTLSPLEGRTPDKLRIDELEMKVSDGGVEEIIIALNPDVEGDTTSRYIADRLKKYGTRITRIAYGIPVGGDIEYADEVTLSRALEGRIEL